jgi:hypothetical protein
MQKTKRNEELKTIQKKLVEINDVVASMLEDVWKHLEALKDAKK